MTTDTTANHFDTGANELEQLALAECAKRQRIDRRVSIMIMPALHCDLASQFAQMGAQVFMADDAVHQHEIEGRILSSGFRDEIRFAPYSLPDLPATDAGDPFDIIVFRRSLCRLPYAEGRKLIRELLKKLRIGGKLYLSIFGLHSALGEGYEHASVDITERFTDLSPAIAKKYGIQGPICLYTERNLFTLLLESGASVLLTSTTTYGNVRAIAVRV